MSNTQKEAGIFGGASAAEKEQMLQKFYGDRLLSSVGAGAGMGLGAAALYHLLRGAKPAGKKEKKYPSYGSGTPMIAKEAFAQPPMSFPLAAMTTMPRPMGLPPGAVPFAAPTLIPPRGAMTFAPQPGNFAQQAAHMFGGSAGAAQTRLNELTSSGFFNDPTKFSFDLNSVSQSIGGALPKTMIPFGAPSVGGGAAPSADPHPWRKSWSTAANIGGAAAGAYAGSKLINAIMQMKKKRDSARALEAARAEYYDALRGKTAAELDVAYESVKSANMLTDAASAVWQTPQTLRTAYLLTLLGAGGLGAKYMYDRTKNLTMGENLARAQASRARTRGLPPVWVDPDSLARVKSTVESDE